MKNHGAVLCRVRMSQRNLTQPYVAEKLGISQSFYSKVENGTKELQFSHVLRFADMIRIDQLEFVKCLIMGEKDEDAAVMRAIQLMKNQAVEPLTPQQGEDAIATIQRFVESKHFDIVGQIIKLLGVDGVIELLKKLDSRGGGRTQKRTKKQSLITPKNHLKNKHQKPASAFTTSPIGSPITLQ